MKRFVRNDKRFYDMTKQQCTFLCIMTIVGSHKNIAKKPTFLCIMTIVGSHKNIAKKPTFLCIMTGYKKVTKLLRKGYKSYKVVISISLWRSAGIHRTGARVCPQWCSVPVYTSKGAAFGELGAAFGGVGSYDSKGATIQRELCLSGALPLWELQL